MPGRFPAVNAAACRVTDSSVPSASSSSASYGSPAAMASATAWYSPMTVSSGRESSRWACAAAFSVSPSPVTR